MPATLYLIPSTLGDGPVTTVPPATLEITRRLRHFVLETGKVGRAYLKRIELHHRLQECEYYELNKQSRTADLHEMLAVLKGGHDLGLLSDAGAPGVADPGAKLVRMVHDAGFRVVPLVGPSAILLSLMAAGLNGQSFTFHGYLSPKRKQLAQDLRRIESASRKHGQTQLWIEAPYRNQATIEVATETLKPDTRFSACVDLTLPTEWIKTAKIADWDRAVGAEIQKRPAIFLLLAG